MKEDHASAAFMLMQDSEKKLMQLKAGRPQLPDRYSPTMMGILAESAPGESHQVKSEYDMDFFEHPARMTRAQFLMAQVDLDPIKSEFSQEQQ
jgi:hypothetical protein